MLTQQTIKLRIKARINYSREKLYYIYEMIQQSEICVGNTPSVFVPRARKTALAGRFGSARIFVLSFLSLAVKIATNLCHVIRKNQPRRKRRDDANFV